MREDGAVAHLQERLDDAHDARHRFHVPEVRLDGPDHDGIRLGVRLGEDVADGAHFDGVAELGAGAVRLDVLDVG
ncbi:hypothetical protein GCM10020000_70790 [Streptomyces olivoverticillatus]